MRCIIVDDDKVSRLLLESHIRKTDILSLESSFESAAEAINYFNSSNAVDLIFLDVEMPDMDGMEFLEVSNNLPQIIIVSAKEKYAVKAIEYDVTDYLVKPVSQSRFLKAVNKAKEKFDDEIARNSAKGIFIKSSSSSFIRLLYDDIVWIEALENYVVINTEDDKYTIHFTMKAILDKIPQDQFKRVHRSFIVNMDKVNMIEDNMMMLKLAGGKKKSVPIAKSYKDQLMKDINVVSK